MSSSYGWHGGAAPREPGENVPGERQDVESVSALTARLRSELLHRFSRVAVRGEIGEWTRASSGHVYFSLKDATARLSAVIWRSTATRVAPRDVPIGTSVIAHGRIDVYAPRGTYALQVDRLALAGRGDLHARFEQLKAALRARGWFDVDRKRALPFLPRTIGVVTSPGGAALQDFLVTLQKRFPAVAVKLQPARVQGPGAAEEIAQAIRALDRRPEIDVVVVTRGGGSLEDLWAFNEEIVARAIFECSRPVISGVGHETDFTIADMVADVRAKTPTEAAVLVVPLRSDLLLGLEQLLARATRAMRHRLRAAHSELEALAAGRALGRPEIEVERFTREIAALDRRATAALRARCAQLASRSAALEQRLFAAAPRHRLARDGERLAAARVRFERATAARLQIAESRLAAGAALLEAHSPVRVLARGYSVASRAGAERALTSVAELEVGAELETVLLDGRVASRVERIVRQESPDAQNGDSERA